MAFLIYRPLRRRRTNESFEGYDNFGALVIVDALERAGISVGFTTPEDAANYKVVLASFTSTHDVFAFYRSVALLPQWQPEARTFKVLAGGFGMQNPCACRRYIDYAFFGRAHDIVADLVTEIADGGEPESEHIMRPMEPQHVTIRQAPLYEYGIGGFQEQFTGCPLKCKFCHYTWAREHTGGTDDPYVQTIYSTNEHSLELTWEGLVALSPDGKGKHVVVGLDGFSERLRFIYGKRITVDDIVIGIERIGAVAAETEGKACYIKCYNIGNMPDEDDFDRQQLYAAIQEARPKARVVFVLFTTPFRPSLATPMQWEVVSLSPSWSKVGGTPIMKDGHLEAYHSYTNEASFSHLMAVLAERATPASDELFHAICFAPGFRKGTAPQKLRLAQKHFDIEPYVREYDPNDPEHPGWHLDGWAGRKTLVNACVKMRDQIGRTRSEPGWLPGSESMVVARLKKQGLLAAVVRDYSAYGSPEVAERLRARASRWDSVAAQLTSAS